MKPKPTNLPSNIDAMRKAMPSGTLQHIMSVTGLKYQLIYNTLRGRVKVWDTRHDIVIAALRKRLNEAKQW
jgi:hypothetical protein